MLKYNWHNIGGKEIKNNEVYKIYDNNELNSLCMSKTVLHRGQQTSGHSHSDKDEIYFFIMGQGTIQVGDEKQTVFEKDVVLIPAGLFHKVWNNGDTNLIFLTVFEGLRNHA